MCIYLWNVFLTNARRRYAYFVVRNASWEHCKDKGKKEGGGSLTFTSRFRAHIRTNPLSSQRQDHYFSLCGQQCMPEKLNLFGLDPKVGRGAFLSGSQGGRGKMQVLYVVWNKKHWRISNKNKTSVTKFITRSFLGKLVSRGFTHTPKTCLVFFGGAQVSKKSGNFLTSVYFCLLYFFEDQ